MNFPKRTISGKDSLVIAILIATLLSFFFLLLYSFLSNIYFTFNHLEGVISYLATQSFGQKIKIGKVKFNPFGGTINVSDIKVENSQPNMPPLINIDKLLISIDLNSFSKTRDLAQSIKGVKIGKLSFYLFCDEKGKWNLPPSKPAKPPKGVPPSFPIAIEAIDGKVEDLYLSKQVWEIKGKGRIVLHQGNTIFSILGAINRAHFSLIGRNSRESLKANLLLKSLNLTLPMGNGLVSANIDIYKTTKRIEWKAQVALSGASITHKKLPFKVKNLSLHFIGNEKVCKIESMEMYSDKGIVLKNGTGVFTMKKPNLIELKGDLEAKAQVFSSILKYGKNSRKIPFSGNFPVKCRIDMVGTLGRPFFEAKLNIPFASFRGMSTYNSSMTVRYFDRKLNIVEGRSYLAGGRIDFHGFLNLENNAFVLGGEANGIDMEKFPDNIKRDIKKFFKLGEYPQARFGNFVFWLENSHEEKEKFEAKGKIEELKYGKVFEKNLYINLKYSDGILSVENIQCGDEKGVFSLTGKLDMRDQRISASLEGMDIDIEKIGNLFGIKGGKGYAYIRGNIEGSLNQPIFEGGIEAFDLTLKNYALEHLLCLLKVNSERIVISQLHFDKGIGEGNAQGEIEISSGNININGEFSNILLTQIVPTEYVQGGTGKGGFAISGSLRSPTVVAHLQGKDILIKDNYIESVQTALRWQEGKGAIEEGRISTLNGEVNFRGGFDKDGLALALEGKNISVEGLPFPETGVSGYIDFTGRLEGPYANPIFEAEIKGNLGYKKGEMGKISAGIYLDKNHAYAREVSYRIGQGTLTANFFYSLKDGEINGYVKGDDLPISLAEMLSQIFSHIKGNLSTVLRISGRVDNPKLVGDFRCKNIGDEFIELTEMEGRYSLDGKKLVVEGLKGSKEDFQLDGKAEIDLKGKNLNYLFSLKNFPFSLFSSFYPKLKSTGKADIELSGKGNISNQVCAFALKSNQLLVNGERLDNLDIIGEWRSDDFDIKSIRFFKGGKQIIGEATLPVGKSLILKKDKPISLKISWEKQNIGFLGKFIPIFEEFTGESSGQIVVKGTISAPDASGYVNFENGYVKPIGFEDYLKNINVKLVLQENKATFERASFQLGEGSVDMNGNIYLGEGFRFETLARLNNAGIKERNLSSYGEKFQGALNGFVNINGNLRNLFFIGNLTLSNARLDLSSYTISPKESKVKRTPVINPAFLLNVNLGKNCWFTSSGSHVLTQGRLTLIGSLINPAMQGHFSSRSGLVRIANYIFRLQEASVDVAYMGKALSLNVFARAETSLRGYKITAYINGPYDSLQIRFASSPPLPQNTILAMFIPQEFASDPEKFFKSELANAFAIGVGTTILAPLEFSLAEITGLEEVSFEYGVEGYPVLRLKESILPKTYLVYSRWLSGPKNRYTVGLEWNIGGDLYLTYSVDELKRKIWGIEGSLRF